MATEARSSMDDILAAARERRLAQSLADSARSEEPRDVPLVAIQSLLQAIEEALGGRVTAVRVQIDKLRARVHKKAKPEDLRAAWAVLDELEDQLEALIR